MSDQRSEFQKFADLARAIVRVPKREIAEQQKATQPAKPGTKRPKS